MQVMWALSEQRLAPEPGLLAAGTRVLVEGSQQLSLREVAMTASAYARRCAGGGSFQGGHSFAAPTYLYLHSCMEHSSEDGLLGAGVRCEHAWGGSALLSLAAAQRAVALP